MDGPIYTKDNISLTAECRDSRLKLRVEVKVSEEKTEIYQAALMTLADGDKLAQNFENFQQVIEQIKDNPNEVQIDIQKLVIVISGKVVGKKTKQITLGVIPIIQKQTIVKQLQEVLLSKVIDVCNSKVELNSDLTKELFQNLSVGLKMLLEERKQMKQWKTKMEARVKVLEQYILSSSKVVQNQKTQQKTEQIKQIKEIKVGNKQFLKQEQTNFNDLSEKMEAQFQQKMDKILNDVYIINEQQKLKKLATLVFKIITPEVVKQHKKYLEGRNILKKNPDQNLKQYVNFSLKKLTRIFNFEGVQLQLQKMLMKHQKLIKHKDRLHALLLQASNMLTKQMIKPMTKSQIRNLTKKQAQFIKSQGSSLLDRMFNAIDKPQDYNMQTLVIAFNLMTADFIDTQKQSIDLFSIGEATSKYQSYIEEQYKLYREALKSMEGKVNEFLMKVNKQVKIK